MKRKFVLFLFVIACISVFFIGCDKQSDNKKDNTPVITELNGEKISQAQLDERFDMFKTNYELQQGKKLGEANDQELLQNLKDLSYENLVLQILLRQEADKQGVLVTDDKVKNELENFKKMQEQSYKGGYEKFLADNKMTEKQLRDELKTTKLFNKMKDKVTADIKVSEEKAQKFYDDNPDYFIKAGGIQISHILLNSEEEARSIIAKLQEGEDFAELAKENSIGPSKDKGGDIGIVNETSNLMPEFKEAALALQSGQITTEPVKTSFGYHVIKAGEKTEDQDISFKEVKYQLQLDLLENEKNKAFNSYLESIREKADIKDYR